MTITSLMGVGQKALYAAYRQVHTIGNNIANVNTEGYSRQQAIQTSDLSMRTGAGWVGTGVSIETVQRASNLFLTDQANALKALSSADSARADMLGQLEKVFGAGEAGLGNAATQLFNAYADLAINPSDLSARQAVLGKLDQFASLARANASQLQSLQDNVRSDIKGAVTQVNEMARQVAALNVQIQNATAQGRAPNDLLDKRDLLVSQMAEQLDVQAYTYADGGMAVFVAGGQPLVMGSDANQLLVDRDDLDPSLTKVSVSIQGQLTLLASHQITGGRIGGLVKFQNEDLLAARNGLGQLVTSVATEMNEQQSRGVSLYREDLAAGETPPPLFTLQAPQMLAATGNAVDAAGRPISSMAAEVVDATALQASDYEVMADPAAVGTYTVTRLSDGTKTSGVLSGDVVDGLRISDGATSPSAGERFLLRGVAHVASTLTVALRDPKALAAAGPLVATLGAANQGSMKVAAMDMVADAPVGGYGAMTLRFTDDAGAYELLDAGGAALASGTWASGQPLVYEGLSLSLSGVPRSGDTVALKLTGFADSNNANALSFARMGERLMVAGQQVGDAYASLMSDMGVRAQGANTAASNSGIAANQAENVLVAETGVNLDEETARLIQYQQSYQAAAKVLQSAQTILDTILGLTR